MTNASYIFDRYGRQVFPSLGETPAAGSKVSAAAAKGSSAISTATSLVSSLIPKSGAQTETGKVASSVASLAGQVALIASVVPVIGPVISVVSGLIAGAATLVDSIFGSSEDQEKMEKAGQWNQANAQLRMQILQVDQKTKAVSDGLSMLDQALKTQGISGLDSPYSGLGNLSDDILANAQASNQELSVALERKTKTLASLITGFNQTVQDTFDAITGKSRIGKYVLWGLFGMAAVGIGAYVISELKKKKK